MQTKEEEKEKKRRNILQRGCFIPPNPPSTNQLLENDSLPCIFT
jgi:hypothetical protein